MSWMERPLCTGVTRITISLPCKLGIFPSFYMRYLIDRKYVSGQRGPVRSEPEIGGSTIGLLNVRIQHVSFVPACLLAVLIRHVFYWTNDVRNGPQPMATYE